MKYFTPKTEWFSWLVLAIAVGSAYYFKDLLPEQVPAHWNAIGEIDRYASPTEHTWTFLGIIFGMYLLFIAIPYLEPRKEHLQKSIGFLHMLKNYMLLFFTSMFVYISYIATTTNQFDITSYITIGIGILFILIGNYLTQVKSNFLMGIRTPWTLSSDDNWTKTHRLGGITFILAGILFMTTSWLPTSFAFSVPIIGVVLAALIPIGYSYWLYTQSK